MHNSSQLVTLSLSLKFGSGARGCAQDSNRDRVPLARHHPKRFTNIRTLRRVFFFHIYQFKYYDTETWTATDRHRFGIFRQLPVLYYRLILLPFPSISISCTDLANLRGGASVAYAGAVAVAVAVAKSK